MKLLNIRLWHGIPSPDFLATSSFGQKVTRLCRRDSNGDFVYDGDISEWASVWKDKFIYYPSEVDSILGTVYITQHGGWGAR